MVTLYGDKISGNCLKTKYVADHLGIKYNWVDVSVLKGESRTEAFLMVNPWGQVPALKAEDGGTLTQSNAIMLYLAEGSPLIPKTNWDRAKMNEWLFWEQYSHETSIAVTRFHVMFQDCNIADRDQALVSKGEAALDRMEEHLQENSWFVGDWFTLADIALYAYTQFAPDAGFSLDERPAIKRWLLQTAQTLGL